MGGPANAFTHIRAFPTAEMRAVVRPNFDTLYSSAWLDLTDGPLILSTADTGGRYFLLPMLDMWTDVFAVPGKQPAVPARRASPSCRPGGPGSCRPAPSESTRRHLSRGSSVARKPTARVITKPFDKIQDGYTITALSEWGKPPRKVNQQIDPSVDTKTEPLRQLRDMAPEVFFSYGAELMKVNPPHLTDWSISLG